jgi:BA14K-like protein
MTRLKLLGATALLSATIASPVLAQDGAMGPGYRYGQPAPTYYNQGYQDQRGGYWRDDGYRDNGFAPLDAAAGVVDGAVDTAGAIATAPFRAMEGGSYAMMQGDASYCAQRYRSYDPQSGTFMGYDGRRHPCQ